MHTVPSAHHYQQTMLVQLRMKLRVRYCKELTCSCYLALSA